TYTPTVTATDPFGVTASTTFTWTVGLEGTTTTVTSSLNASTYGDSVSFTATVAPDVSGTPAGSVQFYIDASLSPFDTEILSGGSATSISISYLTATTHTIKAVYLGDTDFGGSTGTVTQTVNKATLTIKADSDLVTAGQQAFTKVYGAADP